MGPAGEPTTRSGRSASAHCGPARHRRSSRRRFFDALQAMRTLVDVALAHMQHGDHPRRNFARVPGPSSFAGVLGDWLGTGFNAIAASWTGGSGPATVELVALDWLRSLLGMPEGTEGVMTSGGSLANMTALAAARANDGPGVCYLSDQNPPIHRPRACCARVPGRSRPYPGVRPRPAAARRGARRRRARGQRSGQTPRVRRRQCRHDEHGAVHLLPEIADLCRSEGLWFHVDGAYGASAALCDAGRRVLRGIELAHSLVLDPHKWLFQPYDLGCLLVGRPGALKRAFQMTPDYLVDVTAVNDEVDFRDRGLELTRRGRV